MRIVLAPMEGVVDHTMRDMLTTIGGIDRCVTEFIRVTTTRLPSRVFYRFCPELHNNGLTPSGVPVYVQLLGGNPEPMAINAHRAAKLGAPGVDINFGCPAKLVNRNDGGSILLNEPDRIYSIVSAVRAAVPDGIPVTAKIRLGFNDRSRLQDICQSIFAAQASELTIHARTRLDGYKPPAYWDTIAAIKDQSPIPVIANGEIWSVHDYQACIEQSHCEDIMLGRGALALPDLAQQITNYYSALPLAPMAWSEILNLLSRFCSITEEMYERKYVGNRVKQWLGYLRRQYQPANELFEDIKRMQWPEDIAATIEQHKAQFPPRAA